MNNKLAKITNDLNKDFDTDYNLDALDFLKAFEEDSVDLVLFNPPYSPRQISECYKGFGIKVTNETTQLSFWSKQKDEIKRIVKKGGYVITFGWNSSGVGKTRGFEIVEILLVCHGGMHNDTICVVERKCVDSNNSVNNNSNVKINYNVPINKKGQNKNIKLAPNVFDNKDVLEKLGFRESSSGFYFCKYVEEDITINITLINNKSSKTAIKVHNDMQKIMKKLVEENIIVGYKENDYI